MLGSPFNTNEENYLAQKLASEVIATPHVDFSQAAPNRADAIHAKEPESNVDPQTPISGSMAPKP